MSDWERETTDPMHPVRRKMSEQIKRLERRDIRRRIDRYVKGQLNDRQSDQLWADLLRYPEMYHELKIESAIQHIITEG